MEKKWYKGYIDGMFKAIFCDKKIEHLLKWLIERCLGKEIKIIKIITPDIIKPNIYVKNKTLDVLLEVDEGEVISEKSHKVTYDYITNAENTSSSGGFGGGIYNNGLLNINSGTINNNSSYRYNNYGGEGGTVGNNTNVQIYNKNTTSAQKWYIYPRKIMNGKVYYGLASALGGGQYLWVASNSSTSGANVITYQVHDGNGGFWSAENAGSSYYYFKNINGICLHAASNASGANLTANTCNNSNNQKWKFSTS